MTIWLGAAAPAWAQTTSGSSAIQEIVVTARRQQESLQDAPVAVTAFSGEALEEAGLVNLEDVSRFTPGFFFQTGRNGRDSDRPTLRGLTNLRPETEQVVGVFVDGVFVRGNISSLLTDNLERIEIIKGPQSALYGRATFAGAINYITRDPTEEWSGHAQATLGENERRHLSVWAGGPVSGDSLSVAVGVTHYSIDGFVDNNNPLYPDDEIGDQETNAISVKLLSRPTESLSIRSVLSYTEDDDGHTASFLVPADLNDCGPGNAFPDRTVISAACGVQPTDVPTGFNNEQFEEPFVPGGPGVDRKTIRVTLNGDYEFDTGHVFSVLGGWSDENEQTGVDTSYDIGPIPADAFGRPATAWTFTAFEDLRYWSLEARFASPQDRRLRYSAGTSYYSEERDEIYFGILSNLVPGGNGFEVRPGIEIDSWAVYGEVNYDIREDLTFSVESRYYEDDVTAFGGDTNLDLNTKFDFFTPRFILDWRINQDAMLYGSAAKGGKAGGFNTSVPGVFDADVLKFDSETIWSYELGAKTTWADSTIQLNAAVFFMDWKDQQVANLRVFEDIFGQPRVATVIANAGDSEVFGAEVELNWTPVENLLLQASFALADSEFVSGEERENDRFLGTGDLSGLRVPNTPRESATLRATIDFPQVIREADLSLSADYAYASSRFAETQNLIETGDEHIVNVKATLEFDQWRFAIFVKNLLDEDSAANTFRFFQPETFERNAVVVLRRPQEWGLTATYSFGR